MTDSELRAELEQIKTKSRAEKRLPFYDQVRLRAIIEQLRVRGVSS